MSIEQDKKRADQQHVPDGLAAANPLTVATASVRVHRGAPTPESIAASGKRWVVLAVLAGASSLGYLDLFSVNVALPSMSDSLGGASLSGLSWILNAYAIVFAVLLVPMGRLADQFGRRRALLYGVAIFVVGSALSAVAPNLGIMIAGRVIQAVGAALFLPASLGLLYPSFPEHEHGKVLGIWAGIGAVAAGSGPTVGGLLVAVDWRLIFGVNIVIGVAAILGGIKVLPEVRDRTGARFPDPTSVVALIASLALLTFGLVQSATWGWADARTVIVLAIAAVAIAVTIWRAISSPTALVDAKLFRNTEFSAATIGLFAWSTGLAVFVLGNVLYFQEIWHWGVIQTGLGILPGPLGAVLFSLFVGRIIKKYGKSVPAIAGPIVFAIGAAGWLLVGTAHPDHWVLFLIFTLINGFGGGLIQAPLYAAASSLPPDRTATGGAVLNMANSVGSAIGVAILVTLLAAFPGLGGYQAGWWLVIIASIVSAIASVVYAASIRTRPAQSAIAP
jgi:EmrB/QacA subfamily drug resistance transporter